jgi:hypothetical protein
MLLLSIPFPGISTVWVEISGRRKFLVSLPISPIFPVLGRDFRTAALGISTYFRVFRPLGRDFLTAGLGFSTHFAGFPCLGRDFWQAVLGFSTFSRDFRYLGRDFR